MSPRMLRAAIERVSAASSSQGHQLAEEPWRRLYLC